MKFGIGIHNPQLRHSAKGGRRMTGIKLAVLTGIMLMAAISLTAVAAENDTLREMQDRVQINKLMWDYARALDTGNVEAYAATFTEDGQFGRGANAAKGREALKKMVGALMKSRLDTQAKNQQKPSMYHMTANHYIEFIDKDHAVFHGYWIAFVAASGKNTQPNIIGVGRELNELARVNGKWLIKVRDIVPKD
jgi:uncharacterized protein (TIGR02246 family)